MLIYDKIMFMKPLLGPNFDTKEEIAAGINFLDIENKVNGILKNRKEIEILSRRFGISGKTPETLGSIGKKFKVTRERIRQIEKDILRKIDKALVLDDIFLTLEKIISTQGGIISIPSLEKSLKIKDPKSKIFLKIFLEASSRIKKIKTFKIDECWFLKEHSPALILRIIDSAENILKSTKKTVDKKQLVDLIIKDLADLHKKESLNNKFIEKILLYAKNIGRAPEGKLGLAKWGVVNPRNTRDKAFVVLQQIKKPLHYKELTESIRKANFSAKRISIEAVHNELIRDKRFVLVGRGIYALKEWGYKPGTVSEVIYEILKERRVPMHKNEIVKEVLKRRFVKKNTILLNLQEKPQFIRVKRAVYRLKDN